MAKIVGRDERHVQRVTCDNCASIIEYTKNERRKYSSTDYTGGRDTYWEITCPSCGNDINLGYA